MLIPCILYKISTDEIIKFNTFVNSELLPVLGLNTDLEYYAKYVPDVQPAYDSRGYKLITLSVREQIQHPDYPLNRYTTTYSTERLTDEQLKVSVDNEEANANNQLTVINHQANQTRVAKIHHKKIKAEQTTPAEDALADQLDEIADKMDDNADNANNMYDFIEANPNDVPDFDAGWTIE